MLKRFKQVMAAATLLLIPFATSGCWLEDLWNATHPPPQEHIANVPATFFGPIGTSSGAATVKMWQQFYRGTSASQSNIQTFLNAHPR